MENTALRNYCNRRSEETRTGPVGVRCVPFLIEDMRSKSPKNRFEQLEFDRFFVCQSAGIVQRRLAKGAEVAEATGRVAVRRPKTRSDDKTFQPDIADFGPGQTEIHAPT